ncbi:uncharacterized protein LOC129221276 [Uloborus diversus]|uniref:uncharacterized protein LOC129221276 n=1 Tax=Uloborus diversus TaxID=327109 RepID=UPI0024093B2E|nr:uncharacterized protein LOC129221276 [Uloborus diversus]
MQNMRHLPITPVNTRWTVWRRSDYFYPEMIPEPDYSESSEEISSEEENASSDSDAAVERLRDLEEEDEKEEELKRRTASLRHKSDEDLYKASTSFHRPQKSSPSLEDDLIKPKKPFNPYLESSERLKLHKELKFSQKYGKRGVNPKSELQMALEKYAENKLKRSLALSRQTSLEQILELQAKKIEQQELEGTSNRRPSWIDRLHQQNDSWFDPKTDEFYRVHARVVSNVMDNLDLGSEEGDQSPTKTSSVSSKTIKTSESSDQDISD